MQTPGRLPEVLSQIRHEGLRLFISRCFQPSTTFEELLNDPYVRMYVHVCVQECVHVCVYVCMCVCRTADVPYVGARVTHSVLNPSFVLLMAVCNRYGSSCGGVAYVNSFGRTDGSPAFIFVTSLYNYTKYIW